MARSKPWLKLWTEVLRDSKLVSHSASEKGIWLLLLCVGQECAADGRLVNGAGFPLTIPDLARQMFLNDRTEMAILRRLIDYMIEQKSLHWDGNTLVITNFKKRQELAPSDTAEAARQRQRDHRARLKEQSHGNVVTPDIKNLDLPLESHENFRDISPTSLINTNNKDIDIPHPSPSPSRDKSVTSDPFFESGDDITARVIRAQNARDLHSSHEISRDILEVSKKVWQQALEKLVDAVTKANYSTWFEKSEGLSLKNNTLTVEVRSTFIAEYLTHNQRSLVERTLSSVAGKPLQVQFCTKGGTE